VSPLTSFQLTTRVSVFQAVIETPVAGPGRLTALAAADGGELPAASRAETR
jgi:hypothetical protein